MITNQRTEITLLYDDFATVKAEDYGNNEAVRLVFRTAGCESTIVMDKDIADKCAFQLTSWLQDADERSRKPRRRKK